MKHEEINPQVQRNYIPELTSWGHGHQARSALVAKAKRESLQLIEFSWSEF